MVSMHSSSSNNCGILYPHLEERERSICGHGGGGGGLAGLRTAKSEYYLSPPKQQQHQSNASVRSWGAGGHIPRNIDDDTKWINSSSSTASYHSVGSSSRGGGDATDHDDQQHHHHSNRLYAEIGKPVFMASRGYSSSSAHSNTLGGSIYQQTNTNTNNGVGGFGGGVSCDNARSISDVRNTATTPPPPPSMVISSASSMNGGSSGQIQQQPPPPMRKYFTLNNPRNQKQYQPNGPINPRRSTNHHEEDLRRRSMTTTTNPHSDCYPGLQQQLNRSQSCYVDPLDYKVGCQNTLRSKPVIPWYELAIKDNNRRSCPQLMEEVVT